VRYQAYDVTSLLKRGDNTIAALLANDWFSGHQTFDQIKAWLEAHCDKPQKSSSLCQGIAIAVEFSETEYGRADYTVQRSTRGQFDLEDADLRAMVQRAIQAGKALDEVIEHIAEQIHDYAWLQCNPQFEDYGPFNYNAHESTDSGNTKSAPAPTSRRKNSKGYLFRRKNYGSQIYIT
jgi:hypothetical protein